MRALWRIFESKYLRGCCELNGIKMERIEGAQVNGGWCLYQPWILSVFLARKTSLLACCGWLWCTCFQFLDLSGDMRSFLHLALDDLLCEMEWMIEQLQTWVGITLISACMLVTVDPKAFYFYNSWSNRHWPVTAVVWPPFKLAPIKIPCKCLWHTFT